MIINMGYRGKVGASVPKFTYTGDYNVREDGVVELLTSGTLVFLNPAVIDVFCVGGGGAGRFSLYSSNRGYGGGGGGYTNTLKKINVSNSYQITIGDGATPSNSTGLGPRGGTTSFGDLISAEGGHTGSSSGYMTDGSAGGSGGGGGVTSNSNYGMGGSDGGNGENGYGTSGNQNGGAGQATTTREFGEENGKLYAGGGGGGRYIYSSTPIVSMGGAGGGGAGGWAGTIINEYQTAGAGGANTGGGGGGGAIGGSSTKAGAGAGGSGICCFRMAK